MNINKVYVCSIFKRELCESEYDGSIEMCTKDNTIKSVIVDEEFYVVKVLKANIVFVKKALVYYSEKKGCFIDLETMERYNYGIPKSSNYEDLFVNVKKEKIFGNELMHSKRKHFTKKKILKRYNEFRGNQNEC